MPRSRGRRPLAATAAGSYCLRMSPSREPFDAVLLVAFGGPLGPADVRPFLRNVLRGRNIPAARLEDVAQHYELFGGVSPLTRHTMDQAEGLRRELSARGITLPVYVGMRNWTPLLHDTLAQMARDGIRRAIGVLLSAHRSYSGCTQYRHNVAQANEELIADEQPRVEVTYVGDWHTHEGYVAAVSEQLQCARRTLPEALRPAARIVFTAHSIPTRMAGAATYERQLRESATAVAARSGLAQWDLVYQSRSGRPEDPWLEPDINAWLREEASRGLAAVVVSPLGFVCDHIEVLYDLDREARETCTELGVPMALASAVNAHPAFIGTLADAVQTTAERYRAGRPLPLVHPTQPAALELPPPVRPQG